MLTIKMMSDDGIPDDSNLKGFTLIPLGPRDRIKFLKEKNVPDPTADFNFAYQETMRIDYADGSVEQYALRGNVYVLSESGKTIASHSW